jgi:predicted DNA-binding transcriptional regulator YafY
MRPAKDMIRLIQLLSGHKASGLAVEEIAERMEISQRTAHRFLAALKDIEPDLTFRIADDSQKRLWYLPVTTTRLPAVTAQHLSSLTAIASFLRAQGHQDYAQALQNLRDTLQSGLDRAALLRMDPDLEMLENSIEVTHRPGPKSSFDPTIRGELLNAIICESQVEFLYTDVRGQKTSKRVVSPFALVIGPRSYLIGRDEAAGAIRNFALTGIRDIQQRNAPAPRDGFDAGSYVAQSFGAFHDGEFRDWTLRFKPATAHELANCPIPDDHISPRRSALFMARSVLRDIRDGVRAC